MANSTVSGAERAFEAYRNLSATERREFELLRRGYESATAPKAAAKPAQKSKPAAAGKEATTD